MQGAAQVHQGGLEGGPAGPKVGRDAQRCQDAGLVHPGPAQFGLVWFLAQSGSVQFGPIQLSSGFEAARRRGGDLQCRGGVSQLILILIHYH